MFRNKRGQQISEMWGPSTFIFWMIFALVLGVTASTFSYLVNSSHAHAATLNPQAELAVLSDRLLASPSCLASDSGQASIDLRKFTQQQMEACFSGITRDDPAFRLRLAGSDAEITSVTTQNWIEGRPLESRLPEKSVTVIDGNGIRSATLSVEVQNVPG